MRLILRTAAAALTVVALALSLRPDPPPPPAVPAYYAALLAPAYPAPHPTASPSVAFPTWTVDEILATPEGAALLHRREIDALASRRDREAATLRTVESASATTEAPPATGGPVSTPTTTAGAARGLADPGRVAWRPSVERWRDLVSQHFAPADVEMALGIVRCESLGDPDATNRSSGTAGLFQHRPRYWQARSAAAGIPDAPIYDPESNVRVAAWLVYEDGGWQHWGNGDPCEAWARAQTGGD